MSRLRIAVVGHIRHPIARPFMGGMEAFTWELTNALAKRGHDVHLLASGDSAHDLPAGVMLHPILEAHYDRTYPWHDFHGTDTLNAVLDAAFAKAQQVLVTGQFDVVHNNALHPCLPRLSATVKLPMVTSLHVPPFARLADAIAASQCPWHQVTVTSDRQHGIWWPQVAPDTTTVVHNGIALQQWPYQPGGDGSAMWSGRITPTKGTGLAIAAARAADVPLKICGTIEHADYFAAKVQPHLSDRIEYLGHLSATELSALYATASTFLFTPQWEEPFGLAAVEAMATGLPVAATPCGAVQEVLGDAGVVAKENTAQSLAAALTVAGHIAPDVPRRHIEGLFTLPHMIDKFTQLYLRARLGAANGTDLQATDLMHVQRQLTTARQSLANTDMPDQTYPSVVASRD